MGRPLIPNLKIIAGLNYYRTRVGGKTRYIRLPALDDPDFFPSYKALHEPRDSDRMPFPPGSLGALAVEYRASTDFSEIESEVTKANYLRYLGMMSEQYGDRLVRQIRPVHVYKMRDKMKDKPGKANNWLSIFRTLMTYATKMDWRADNPASRVPALKIDEYEPWPAELVEVCLAVATPMTRLLIVTGLCSGQRVSDCIRMQHGWIKDGVMGPFVQKKTKVEVAVPVHPFWRSELDALPRRSVTLLYDRFGKPFGTTGAIQARFRDLMAHPDVLSVIADMEARERVEPNTKWVFHGLRKNASCYLTEMGKNEHEIGRMLGMSPDMVRHYSKRARALMIAQTAAAEMKVGKLLSLPGVNTSHGGPNNVKKKQ